MNATSLLQKAAALAAISLEADEGERLKGDLQKIFSFLNDLKDVPTEHVEPLTTPVSEALSLSDGVLQPGIGVQDLLKNAPHSGCDLFLVPQFVDR